VKGTSAPRTRASLRGAPHGQEPRPVSTFTAQTMCARETDSGDSGTEEIAKRHPNPSPPCGYKSGIPNNGVERAEGVTFSVSSPLQIKCVHSLMIGVLGGRSGNVETPCQC